MSQGVLMRTLIWGREPLQGKRWHGGVESFDVSAKTFATFVLSPGLKTRRIKVLNLWAASIDGGFLAWMLWLQGSQRIPPRKRVCR